MITDRSINLDDTCARIATRGGEARQRGRPLCPGRRVSFAGCVSCWRHAWRCWDPW